MIAVTGANGFLGRNLVQSCLAAGKPVRAIVRTPAHGSDIHLRQRNVAVASITDICSTAELITAFEGANTVIHCAGDAGNGYSMTRKNRANIYVANTVGAESVMHAAAAACVRRVIFISSVKVNGEYTVKGQSFTSSDLERPMTAYAFSKLFAELKIKFIADERNLSYVLIRPSPVVGSGAAGNFKKLISLVRAGIPIPVGRSPNSRAIISVQNLCDVILKCVDNSIVDRKTIFASNPVEYSTEELVIMIAAALGVAPRILRPPVILTRVLDGVNYPIPLYDSLFRSLSVNISETCEVLRWSPRDDVRSALGSMIATLN